MLCTLPPPPLPLSSSTLPPPPPPDGKAKATLTFVAVIAATFESFDRDAYKSKLAALLDGVSPANINLEVSAASVRVAASIMLQSRVDGDQARATLSEKTPLELSLALNVTVVSVESVALEQSSEEASSDGGITLAYGLIVGGIAVLILLLLGSLVGGCVAMKRERHRSRQTMPGSANAWQTMPGSAIPTGVAVHVTSSSSVQMAATMQTGTDHSSPRTHSRAGLYEPRGAEVDAQQPERLAPLATHFPRKFDPNTGQPLPKFDPYTGVQNW